MVAAHVDLHLENAHLTDAVAHFLPAVCFGVPFSVFLHQSGVVADVHHLNKPLGRLTEIWLSVAFFHYLGCLESELHEDAEHLTWILAPPTHGVECLLWMDFLSDELIYRTSAALQVVDDGTEVLWHSVA